MNKQTIRVLLRPELISTIGSKPNSISMITTIDIFLELCKHTPRFKITEYYI